MQTSQTHTVTGAGISKASVDMALRAIGYSLDVVITGRATVVDQLLDQIFGDPGFNPETSTAAAREGIMGRYKYAKIRKQIQGLDEFAANELLIYHIMDGSEPWLIIDTSLAP